MPAEKMPNTLLFTQNVPFALFPYAHLLGILTPSTIVLVMKKLLLLFMLALLPLQASWAVVSMYCQQEQEVCVVNCYSNDQEQRAYLIDDSKQTTSTSGFLDQHEHSCQGSAASFILSSQQPTPSFSSSLTPQFHDVLLSLPIFTERPERPKWLPLT